MGYPEIEKLKGYYNQHKIFIRKSEVIRADLFYVDFTIDGQSFKILVDDEYGDFSDGKPLMNLFLVLFSLELYDETEDLLEWSKELYVKPVNYLDYYRELDNNYRKIQSKLGEIDACISSYDYELRTSVIQELMNYKYNT
ncbi:hypothetical protein [Flammeovirga aprica]|uniref:Uncharacterized protein n=1 Tax=Flammeovirga aprica JL-4 TaxID=694437 RepID=A0A7X9RY46_9BACT|nr:hypothetical protein [Flammeovirga aprica]NME70866.1 hypothetical protein [Flammeovirga aprica JL-4]